MNETMVFALTANVELVDEICGYLNLEPGKISVKHFADGEILVEPEETVRSKKVYIVQSTCNPVTERLMELLVCVDAMKRASAGEITCIMPYYGYARQDRKARPRQPITAKLVADLLEAAGANRVVTIDLHATQIQGFFNFPTDDLTCIPMMAYHYKHSGLDLSNVVAVSPDHGGTTRARRLAEALGVPLAIGDKRRPRPNVCEATSVIGDVLGKDVIVVDDICDTGGSLVAACNILRDNGARDIYVAVSHGVFSGDAAKNIQNSPIKKLVISNTIPLSEKFKAECDKVEVLSVGKLLSRIIAAISSHQPVSEIYDLMYNDDHNNA